MIRIGLFGAGFIGSVHARNISRHSDLELTVIFDPNADAARKLADETGAVAAETESDVLNRKIDAVVIASSTDTHADLLQQTTRAGIPVLCEKPIHLDLKVVVDTARACLETGTPVTLGFNRRFDREHAMLRERVANGKLGSIELLHMVSRGPAPPPISYVRVSGGLFRDSMIHFFDLACWIAGERPEEVFAYGSCMVDPAIGAAGDIDTSAALMRMPSGALVTIDNSRRTAYGYDERIEAFCAQGMVQSTCHPENHLVVHGPDGRLSAGPHAGWFERMEPTYRAELDSFVAGLDRGGVVGPTLQDGVRAQLLAEAAERSRMEHVSVRPDWAVLDALERTG